MLVCVFANTNCTRDRGCSAHPVFPAPSCFLGVEIEARLGRIAQRECRRFSRGGHCERSEAIQLFSFLLEQWIASSQGLLAMTLQGASLSPQRSSGSRRRDPVVAVADDREAPTAAPPPVLPESLPRSGCPCESFSGRTSRSA